MTYCRQRKWGVGSGGASAAGGFPSVGDWRSGEWKRAIFM